MAEGEERPCLEAKVVYILMNKDHRISRNRRAEWFFSRFNFVFSLPSEEELALNKREEVTEDFCVVSAIPKDQPPEWSVEKRHEFRYRISMKTVVTYLSRRYRIVYCIDVSPSVSAVDIQSGSVVFDGVFKAIKTSLDGLMRPFYIPGSNIVFQPQIYVTVITHSPFVACINSEVIVQGKLLMPATFDEILTVIFEKLHAIENKMAVMTDNFLKKLLRTRKKEKTPSGDGPSTGQWFKSSISSDFSLIDLLKQALLALSLLPENSSSGLVILTDGVISVPDGRFLDIILSQLRYNTVSCSFIQLSSPFHPHLCHGSLPYSDLMRFIAAATFGAFMTDAPEMEPTITDMNIYHLAFLAWSFQSSENLFTDLQWQPSKPGEWSIRNKCFFTVRDMPIIKKLQFTTSLAVDYMKVLSCRLREGFMIKDVTNTDDGRYKITLVLPWKFLIQLEYIVITDKSSDSQTDCSLLLEGPYDFLHDVTCLASKPFPSVYRQLMVNRFWATRKNLAESDRLLVHLNSFSTSPAYYTVPDSLRNGIPLFYFSSNASIPQLQNSDFPYPQFAQFWKPVCMLDTNVWQKWMHTHRIGLVLEHDHPLPKYLHCPNPAGRFQVILCRQAVMALNTLLKNVSSFVLVENHSYVSLMYSDPENTVPFSFYIIRVTSKAPHVVLRLAFLVGTPGNLRHKTVSELKQKISVLTFPQRLKDPPRWRIPSGGANTGGDQPSKTTWADMLCCNPMNKPIEKILIRYERVPGNLCEVLMPQHSDDTMQELRVAQTQRPSTFGFKPTHPSPGNTNVILPEMFNTVARYLHHTRWIWYFPRCILQDFAVKDGAEILSMITKLRLQEGFRFAYSANGTVSMVLEVMMENTVPCSNGTESNVLPNETVESYKTPCVVQFVMFPPRCNLSRPVDDDELEMPEPETSDLFLIMECWVEPQCGKIVNCVSPHLNGLVYSEVAGKIDEINRECILTLGAFDFLRGAPKSNHMDFQNSVTLPHYLPPKSELADNNILFLPFILDLGRVLPKCSQSEILFSMFFQDSKNVFSLEPKNEFVAYHERSNELLYTLWTKSLSQVHDKEIKIDPRYFETLLTMVLSREDVSKNGRESSKYDTHELPAWRCYVKSSGPSQQLITLIPKTLRDARLHYLIIEKCKCVLTSSDPTNERSPFLVPFIPQIAADEAAKLRQRKVSAPNFCQKSASASLVSQLSLENPCDTVIGRKRIRALSGGESAPVLKKAFKVDSSLHETLVHTFFRETASKYIVPKNECTTFEKVRLDWHDENPYNLLELSSSPKLVEPLAPNLDLPDEGEKNLVGSLTMPIFIYDCSLSVLRSLLMYKETQYIVDRCLDFRLFCLKSEKSGGEEDEVSERSRVEEVDARNEMEELELTTNEFQDYCNTLRLTYRNTFIRSVFQSLQLGYYISTDDLKAAVNISQKNVFTIDITEFLLSTWNHCCVSTNGSCSCEEIRNFVQTRFRRIISRKFDCTKADADLFYFHMDRFSQDTFSLNFSSFSSALELEDRYREANRESPSELFKADCERSSSRKASESSSCSAIVPLFMLLQCTLQTSEKTESVIVSELPVCRNDFGDLSSGTPSKCSLQLILLTCATEFSQTSSEITSVHQCHNVSSEQLEGLSAMIHEIKWLLNDEINSLSCNNPCISKETLQKVAGHVQTSQGKQGCFQQSIVLKFIDDSSAGREKFIDQFSTVVPEGFSFERVESWWYLLGSGEDVVDRRLPFWILFEVEKDVVLCYSHCRYDEDNVDALQQCNEVRRAILRNILKLIRIVNQDLLLQSLHDTGICHPLLEPEATRASPDENPFSKISYVDGANRQDLEISISANSNVPGAFACDVIWETTFNLHPRLKSGPGKSVFARGMQILRSILMAFEVSNRENMFVYRDSSGRVFYLRLYRVLETYDDVISECPSENPSPRSSVSIRTRIPYVERNKDDLPIVLREKVLLLSSGGSPSDGIVLLKVHGVTEAGKEVREDLIQSLRNKLDDAVLEVLSITLDRNPHCKLTPEDVHFIQKPLSSPDAVIRFSTGKFVKLLLPAFAYYFHQNLLQFMNIPKYTRNEHEFHFQDYHDDEPSDDHNVYLYNQSPGETGSRGIACVAVSFVDKRGSFLRCSDWKRPWNFQFSLQMQELHTFVAADEIQKDGPLSDVMVEMRIWKQGRINLEILKNNLLMAIKHGGWDLAMEYQVITPNWLSPAAMDEQDTIERSKDLMMGFKLSPSSGSPTETCGRLLRRRNSSAAPLGKFEDEQGLGVRERSWSYSVKGRLPSTGPQELPDSPFEPPLSKNTFRGSTVSTETIRSNFDFSSLRKNVVEDISHLHPNYSSKFKKWCNIGVSLNVPSLRIEEIKLKPRPYLDETLHEITKMMHACAPDNSVAQFWKLEPSMREFASVGRKIHPEYESQMKKDARDFQRLKEDERKLKNLEAKDEAEYPEGLLNLFKNRENFLPSSESCSCILFGRNLSHWDACVHNRRALDSSFFSSEVIKSFYKFFPLMSEQMNLGDERSSVSTEKMKSSTKHGVLALLGDTWEEGGCFQAILVPRQRVLIAWFTKNNAKFMFYNWSKDSSDKLLDQIKSYTTWSQLRWEMTSSILHQKAGIFYNQPLFRNEKTGPGYQINSYSDIKDLVKNAYPPKQQIDRNSSKGFSDYFSHTSEIYRNLNHAHLLPLRDRFIEHPGIIHGEQLLGLLTKGKKDVESSLFRYWLSRGPSASNIIGKEAIDALKQIARTIHFCMTPIFFLPRWRTAIALTRDSSSGIYKRSRVNESDLMMFMPEKQRPRHASENSNRSQQSVQKEKSLAPPATLWTLWKRSQAAVFLKSDKDSESSSGRSPKKNADAWHNTLCYTYIQDYMQYLQTLGFIPAQGNSVAKKGSTSSTSSINQSPGENWNQSFNSREDRSKGQNDRQSIDSDKLPASTSSDKGSLDKNEKIYYLQKSLPGGIILLEVGFIEPFNYCKILALEVHRIQGNKVAQRAVTSHNTIAFVDECDKMKILMHLHSFAYDFHLRTIQNHICGKQIIQQGYNVVKFLDDFISYYCKGPNFARNTVDIGILSLQNISTPSHILFDYILSNNKKYKMSVLRMDSLAQKSCQTNEPVSSASHEYALVYALSKRVAYRGSEDENHVGEFEMSLVITHDNGGRFHGSDPSVLRIKYYIVLTSRRELYPNLSGLSLAGGKLFPVTTPEPLSEFRKELQRRSIDDGGSHSLLSETDLDSQSSFSESREHRLSESASHSVIKEEKVYYMGYFSSHEQVMQEILKEQSVWAEQFISKIVEAAAVDCRRDLLWQRLQVGGKAQPQMKGEQDELTLRETVGVLTYWEFTELLELINMRSIKSLDPQLGPLLNQPVTFFQALIKIMSQTTRYEHRYFVAPDEKIHQLVMINPHLNKSVILAEVNLIKRTSDISVLFKDVNDSAIKELNQELEETQVHNLIETAVSACCYCNWINCL